MKKTIVGIMTVVAMIVTILGTNVNAASVRHNVEEGKNVKKDEKVVVTVDMDNEVESFDIEIGYNKDAFRYDNARIVVENPADPEEGAQYTKVINKDIPGTAICSGMSTTDKTKKVEFTFTALKDLDKDEEFKITRFVNKANETVNNGTATVAYAAVATEEPEDPTATVTDTPAPTATATTEPTDDGKKEENNNKVVLPQTGAPVYAYVAGIALVAIVAGAVVAVRKNK